MKHRLLSSLGLVERGAECLFFFSGKVGFGGFSSFGVEGWVLPGWEWGLGF